MSADLIDERRVDEAASSDQEYIDDLWFLLHHSEDEDRLVVGLTSYLDDSGSDDGSPVVTCGGPVMSRIQFREFSKRWGRMLARQRINPPLEQPLHISDFLGMGKYAGLYPEFKRALFRDVSKLVNEHKLYSISIAVSQTDFKNQLSEDVRNHLIGPYAFAFFVLVAANQTISEKLKSGPLRISYLIDRGFGHQEQLNQAHELMVNLEKRSGGFRHIGTLGTALDDDIPALQAADAISWASRKMQLNGILPEGFETLDELIREHSPTPHQTIRIPPDGIGMLATPINNWISRKGVMPTLGDIVVRKLQDLPKT